MLYVIFSAHFHFNYPFQTWSYQLRPVVVLGVISSHPAGVQMHPNVKNCLNPSV